ncbi:solute carrier family 25 member 35-like [Cotesia typhae]|uniref:solute carrier family 25 member 35-like n=1 Tax=Cotesia typhae TaxID=2053667 RepID=UPI003D6846F6
MTETIKNKPLGAEFVLGAASAVGAGIFTNPIDVIKIRLQLQGELEARGSYKKYYKNTFHAGYMIVKHEGIRGLQSGIASALAFQVVLNGIRLGSYKISRTYGITVNEDGQTNIVSTALVSGLAGCVGAVLGSPFYLVKTQMQAQTAETSIAVGFQHGHASEWSAFQSLWREAGLAGLYQRWYANIPRVFVGSATQLTAFSLIGDWLKTFSIFNGHPLMLTFCSAVIGGSSVALTMQPFDVVATRLYNQGSDSRGQGVLYKNFLDALIKISRTEGLYGLYKGTFPTWMRIAPHTVLCLCFYEHLERFYDKLIAKKSITLLTEEF